MTKKLYYDNGYLSIFEAKVIACEPYKEGYEVILDQTAFYPEGGGQPSDIGRLDDLKVSYVYEKDDEVIYHRVESPIEVGKIVTGKINFDRRFDFMQQHSGEHILSGLIHAHYGYNNVGFHLSSDYTTADFDGKLTKEDVLRLENEANEAIYRNVEINATLYSNEEAKKKVYRSKLDLTGQVRLVTIPGYDACACCGIHVKHAGEIGMIKCIASDSHRGGTRITLVCGKRALKRMQQSQDVLSEAGQCLSSGLDTLVAGIKRLQLELEQYKEKTISLNSILMGYKAEAYLAQKEERLFIYEEELSLEELRRLVLYISQQTERIILGVSGDGGNLKYVVVSNNEDVRVINKELISKFSGKGGGKPGLCQGSVLADVEDVRNFYQKMI